MKFFVLLLVFVSSGNFLGCVSASFFDALSYFLGIKSPKRVTFFAGDVILCDVSPVAFGLAYHAMLATSNSTVGHLQGEKLINKYVLAYLLEEDFSSYESRVNNKRMDCWVEHKAKLSNAVERARKDIRYWNDNSLNYNPLHCNCDHWVMYWANGDAYSHQVHLLTGGYPWYGVCQIGIYNRYMNY